MVHRRDRRCDGVADVREAPRLLAGAVDLEDAAVEKRLAHPAEEHVGALARAVHREVAQHYGVGAVRVCELLAPELRDPVRRDRARTGVLGRRIRLSLAVHGGRRGEDDAHACAHARLEDALRRDQVPAHVQREDVAEAADARLCGQMEDTVHTIEVERFLGEVETAHIEPARVFLLLGRVVVVREAVDAGDVVARFLQCLRKVRADEAGGSGDDVSHREEEVNRAA